MTLPRRSFLKSIAAALAGVTAIRSAVTPVAEAVEPLAEFSKKGLLIHNALPVDVHHEMMARLGRELAERVDRWCWCSAGRSPTTLPEGWKTTSVAGWPVRRIHATTGVDASGYPKSANTIHPYHGIAFGLPHGTTK